jgi:hypothetical protein
MPWGVIKSTYTVPELKYKDVSAAGTVTAAGAFILTNGLNLGTSAVTRVGRQIMMKSFHIKLVMAGAPFSSTPTSPSSLIRVMVVFDAQPNGTAPATSDLLEDASSGVGIVSSTALKYSGRFKILWDKRWVLVNSLTATTTADLTEQYDEKYMKINLKTIYANTNNGDITDIETGALWIFLTTESGTTANQPVLQYYFRIRYVDN